MHPVQCPQLELAHLHHRLVGDLRLLLLCLPWSLPPDRDDATSPCDSACREPVRLLKNNYCTYFWVALFSSNYWIIYFIFISFYFLFRPPQKRRPNAAYRDHQIYRYIILSVAKYMKNPEVIRPFIDHMEKLYPLRHPLADQQQMNELSPNVNDAEPSVGEDWGADQGDSRSRIASAATEIAAAFG